MQLTDWAPEHSDALRQYRAEGMSYAQIANAINARFGTAYSRNAALGRSKRMGLPDPDTSKDRTARLPKHQLKAKREQPDKKCEARAPEPARHGPPAPQRTEPLKLRCVGIAPRLISLIELEDGHCRYPYGGDKDGEAIVFCGHPQSPGSCYCTAHFHLTRGPGTASERAVAPVPLRLVKAA